MPTSLESRTEDHLAFLYGAARRLLSTRQPSDLLASVFTELSDLLSLEFYFNYVFRDSATDLELDSCAGLDAAARSDAARLKRGEAVCGRVAASGEPAILSHVGEGTDPETQLIRSFGVRAYACHPLRASGRIVGTLSFGTRNRDAFTPAEVALMAGVSDLAAAAVERSIQHAHRARAEMESLLRERHLRAVLEAEPECVKLVARDGMVIEMNPAGLRMLAAESPGDVVGQCIYDFVAAEHRHEFLVNTQAAFEGQESVVEFVIVGLDGRRRWVLSHIVPFRDYAGHVAAALSITRDITAQKEAHERLLQAERHYRSLIENLSELLFLVDDEGVVHYASPSVERSTGWNVDELIGGSITHLVHPDDRVTALERLRAGSVGQRAGSFLELRGLHRDGSVRVFDCRAAPYRTPAADRPWLVITARDVTGQRAVEEQLRHAQRLEAVGRLAAGAAHDFNNMLTAISGHAEFGVAAENGSAARHEFRHIITAAERAASLTRQLLAFSRQQVLEPAVLDLRDLVDAIAPMLRRLLSDRGDLLIRHSPSPGLVLLDRAQFEQVLVNLVVNAADAMPHGGKVTISTTDLVVPDPASDDVPPGHYVRLSVADTGVGMDPDTLSRAFEPFFTTKDPGKGTGLGLSTVYGIVKQSGGYITAHSEPGRGTRFDIAFPAVDAAAPAPERTSMDPGHAEGSETILLVDDEPAVRSVGERALRKAGFTVLSAENADAALRFARDPSLAIDLVVSDVAMPDLNGLALARQLRQDRPGIPILFISGYSGEDLQKEVLAAGYPLLAKPFSPGDLTRTARRVLDD